MLICCLIIGTIVMFLLDNYAGFWEDEVFQAICVKRYREAPLGLLTFYIGHLWTEIFGFSILNLRYLVSIESTLAVGVSSFYLYRLTRNRLLTGFSFMLGCVLLKCTAFSLYNWDSGTYLFDSIAICLLISLISRPGSAKAILLGVTIGLMTLGRTPSGIFLPLAMGVVLIANKYNHFHMNPWKVLLLILTGWVVCIIGFTSLISGSPENYINSFLDGNIVSGHSITDDKRRLYYRFLFIIERVTTTWAPGVGCLLLAIVLPKLKKRLSIILCVLPWLLFCLFLADRITRNSPTYLGFLGGDASVGIGLLAVYPVYLLFSGKRKDNFLSLKLWAVLLLYVSMAFGSDAYFERITTGFSVPLIIGLLWQVRIPRIRRYIKYFSFTAILTFYTVFITQSQRIFRTFTYNDITLTLPPFQGIKTNPNNESELLRFEPAIKFLKSKGTRFAVIGDHIRIELVYGHHDGLPFHEFQNNLLDIEVWKTYKDELTRRVDAFVYPVGKYLFDDGIVEDIERAGFTDSLRMGDAVILFRDGYNRNEATDSVISANYDESSEAGTNSCVR